MHKHRYHLQSTKKEFEPVQPELFEGSDIAGLDVYVMVEYAYLMCMDPSCNHVYKIIIQREKDTNGKEG